MIQVRNVPDPLHRKLKARAAAAGKSLSDYLLAQIAEMAEQPTLDELRARIAALAPIPEDAPISAKLVREERDSR
jgi:plasmid stability protein